MQTVEEANALELSRKAARVFADKWASVTNEKQFAQSFWSEFFHQVIGIEDLLATGIDFEYPVKNIVTGTTNFIDVLWKNTVLIEHKSFSKDLDKAEKQGRDYLVSLPPAVVPPILIVSDFANIRIIDVLQNTQVQFPLTELPDHLDRVEAIFQKYTKHATGQELDADVKAAQLMADLYIELEKNGYGGHEVSVFMVRILFLLFGDDTRMWKKGLFADILEDSPISGNGLGGTIQELFQNLNLDKDKRPKNLNPMIEAFPYVNGGLFAQPLPVFSFTAEMRTALLNASKYDWKHVNPAIFGALFQDIKSKEARRELGEHYTSQTNIYKVIRPLFLDDYLDRLRKVWDDKSGLRRLRKDLGSKRYLDPAAGSGNFLLVTFKALRDIEHKIIARLIDLEGKVSQSGEEGVLALQVGLDGSIGLSVRAEQFYAIEYEEFSAQIASVAIYLANHQANQELDELTGNAPPILPLHSSAKIVTGNSLELDWTDVCPIDDDTVLLGNPPFYGSTWLNAEQRADQDKVWGDIKGHGILDYVASWYLVAARHMQGTKAKAAFVSSNSITQGQQPPVLWGALYPLGMGIDFAHRTFAWSNEGGKNAAVHCVIIGFSANPKPATRSLWSYATIKSEPVLVKVKNINAYLLDAVDVLISSRSLPIQPGVERMTNGNKPVDGGLLSNISPEDAANIRKNDPIAAKYLHRVMGSQELINGDVRYGLWLKGANPSDLVNSPELKERIAGVRALRLASVKPSTKKSADRPSEWQEDLRQPTTDYLAVPAVSSYDRDYVPIGYVSPDVLANNLLSYIPTASKSTFGIITSRVFNVWSMAVSGRLKSDPRISNEVTYNNFPFPDFSDPRVKAKVEVASDAVLAARAEYPDSSLADLYNRNAMPAALRAAHNALDKAVLNAYGLKTNTSDAGILELLFEMYAAQIDGLLAAPSKKSTRKRATT